MTTTRDTDWLLTAILDPNAAVEARYLGYTAETKSGREFTGIITAETPNNLVMRGADGTEETILRTDLKQLLGSGLSLMPEGMESALKPQDMADLLAFIRAK
jgi:putative heme-binding domain-containing protein